MPSSTPASPPESERWYHGITRYQWMILAIASAGWIFDVYESQVFAITRGHLLGDILRDLGENAAQLWGDRLFAVFLLGGTVGGLAAGSLADRYGRRPILVLTILMYSQFSGLTFFATELWHIVTLRFLVALGVGGEWAVAASLVSEVFPPRARPQASGIFHASSVLGTWMAALAGIAVGAQWRYAYLFGILPALLILWIRVSVREPERWRAAAEHAKESTTKKSQLGSFTNLLTEAPWNRRAFLGMLLAAVGLGTFWAVTVAGQNLAEDVLLRTGTSPTVAARKAKFAYGIVQTAGGGLGLLAFGPISARLGRRPAFVGFHLLAFAVVPIACYVPQTYAQLLAWLPLFGFCTLGMHAGYAIYFPELFPTHLRATGASFCFNGGRVAAAATLWLSSALKSMPGMSLQLAMTLLGCLFLVGAALMAFLPETNRKELPQ